MLNYLNVCVEEYKEALGEKQIYKMNRKTRAYYRSLYDMLDSKDMSYISYADIPDKLNSVYDNEVLAPNLIDVLSFFKWLDRDKDGLIDFPEFLRGCILYALNVEKNKKKKKKKGKRGGKKAKKRSGGGFASPR